MAVSFAAEGAVGYITLDKPPANSYDKDFMEEMGAAVDAAAADDAVKAVIVRVGLQAVLLRGGRHQGVPGQRHGRQHGDDRARA